jgi:conjugative transfer signal peptidase TraF
VTVAPATVTRRVRRLRRLALAGAALLIAAGLTFAVTRALGLWINATASMPEGIYRLTRFDGTPLARGTVVAICPSAAVLAVAIPRHYLEPGSCPGHVEPLLKHVAAVAGDRVDVAEHAISVNGTPLANSGRFARDCGGRPLPRIRAGRYTIAPHTVWVYAPVGRSWDSRYYGALPESGILGTAQPFLIFGLGNADCTS